ncbi:MAG TPA: glycosyltransferase family 39 protein [Blastocatellia bacterium]|nr:glycosyltransferase family 39 protein [Blastocatellia bacterium]
MKASAFRFKTTEPEESRPNPQSAIRNPQWILPILLCLIYFLILAFLSRAHPFGTYATETDFYQYYAPDAARIAAGQFSENPFQGPGYPVLLALVAKLTGDVFIAGKWISVISATLAVYLVFLLFSRLFGYWAGAGAQLITMASGQFPVFAINATTDAFFLLLCCAVLVVFLGERIPLRWRMALAALLTGLAYLTRYNGLFLVAACLVGIVFINLFDQSRRERWKLASLFVAVFILTASPWFYANWKHRGSPLYNANYLNIATEFYPELAGGNVFQDGTRALEKRFHSFGDVVRYDPKRMFTGYPLNLWESLKLSVTSDLLSQWVGWLALLGLVLALARRRTKPVTVVLIAGGLYLLLMALSHWEARYYFFVMALYAGLAVYAVSGLFELARSRGWLMHRAFALAPAALVLALAGMSFAQSRREVQSFLASHPTEVIGARDYILSTNPPPHSLRIVSRKPHLAYFTHQDWVFIPQFKSLDELRAWLASNHVDYLAISARELKERKELKPLGDPKAAPPWLKAAWVSTKPLYILYRPEPMP